MLKQIVRNASREPLAAVAILLTIILAVLQSDWLEERLEAEVAITAHYDEAADGRCSLLAFSIDNHTDRAAIDVKISIIADSFVNLGQAQLSYFSRADALIGTNEPMPITYREDLGVNYAFASRVLRIAVLRPGDYVDFFRTVSVTTEIAQFRRNQASDNDRSRFTPRIGNASHAAGRIEITNRGACFREFEQRD